MWLLKLVYAAVVFSWILSYVVTGSEKSIIAKLENQIEIASLHVQYLTENIQEIRTFAIAEKRRFIDLKDSRRILEQEAKAISEKKTLSKYDSSSSTNMQMVQGISTDKKSTKTVLKWHENRKSLLRDRIMFLQRQLQESSRTNVIEK